MEHECAVRHEGLLAAATWAAHRRGLVVFRAQVVPQIGGVLEDPVAVCAEVVLVAIVFLEFLIVIE